MPTPEFWIIAGPNGAGKTTIAQRWPIRELIPGLRPFNPDDRTLEKLQALGYAGFQAAPLDVLAATFLQAADEVFQDVVRGLQRDQVVGVETVLSTPKYRPVVEEVRQRGGFVGLIYVALQSPLIAEQRVERRVRAGGHSVPADRIRARWQRSLLQLPWFAARAHRLLVFDNSDSNPENPPRLIAEGMQGIITIHDADAIPELTAALNAASRA